MNDKLLGNINCLPHGKKPMEELIQLILTAVIALIASCGGSFFGSLVALSKTKKEKLWLQKQEAYLSIIEAWNAIRIWTSSASWEYEGFIGNELPPAGKKSQKLGKNAGEALDVLKKHIHLGNLIFSQQATKRLHEMLTSYESKDFSFWEFEEPREFNAISEHYSELNELTERYLTEVKDVARKDLGL